MPVDSSHPDYSSKTARWHKQRDAFAGEDAVKGAISGWDSRTGIQGASASYGYYSGIYLDKPEGFNDAHFARYIRRAKWYGATKRTVAGFAGAIFQKEAEIIASAAFEQHKENITLTGIDLENFSHTLLRDILLIGRYGVLVDFNEDVQQPYWSGFPAECICNWRTELIRGKHELSLVVLKEQAYGYGEDEFCLECQDQYRVARLNDQGQYEVQIYRKQGPTGNEIVLLDEYIPTRRGQALDFIPFQFFGSESLTPDISCGPLDDLVDINFAYFRHSADYEHGLYLTGLPTAVITGYEDRDSIFVIGSLTAWVLPPPEAKVYFLEYQGQGLQSHERAMDNDKIEMATLGARLLEEQPDVQETLGAVQLRHAGDTGNLKSIANMISKGLSNILRIHEWWAGQTENHEDPRIMMQLNTDLATARLKPQDLQALMLAWQQGGISKETLLWNLQQGEVLPPGLTIEDEIRRIEIEAPARIPFGPDEVVSEEEDDAA